MLRCSSNIRTHLPTQFFHDSCPRPLHVTSLRYLSSSTDRTARGGFPSRPPRHLSARPTDSRRQKPAVVGNVVLPPNGITDAHDLSSRWTARIADSVRADHRRRILAGPARRGRSGHIDVPQRVCDSTRPQPVHRSWWPSGYYSTRQRCPRVSERGHNNVDP
ncbi:hypothetical protein BJV78DRAFT_335139 [Lactifluus subvellereus]|nr:hypothetical protein BJV78DRAFT_335139 [Lactifluus subvellereus]